MDKASLVEQVKAIQRQDDESKQAWWTYCDTNLGGIKDPNRHDAATLGDFIHWYHAGGGAAASRGGGGGGKKGGKGGAGKGGGKGKDWASDPWGGAGGGVWSPPATPPSWAAAGWGGKGAAAAIIPAMGGGGGGSNLGDFVKTGQRASVHWKNAWQTYCTLYGGRVNDPSRHEDPHITGFIDYVGQLAYADLQAVAAEQGVPLDSGPVGGGGAKRAAAAMEWHQPPAKRGGGYYEEPAPSLGDAVEDAQKVMLVAKIKSLQRSNPEAKEAWWSYCDENFKGHKDPNRQDAESLEAFLQTYGL